MAAYEKEFPSEGVDWAKLSATAGVDFDALREKYSKLKAENTAPATSISQEEVERIEAMDPIRACERCYGTGIEKYTYNFQVKEQNCTACSGEGLIRQLSGVIKSSEDKSYGTSAESEIIGTENSNLPEAAVKVIIEEGGDTDDEDDLIEPPPMPM